MKAISFFFVVVFCFATIHSLHAQVKASDVMPLDQGRYVEYHEYDTVSNGVALKYSSYKVLQSGISYQGESGVSLVSDTSAMDKGDTTSVVPLYYRFDSNGNLQVFADSNLVKSVLGKQLSNGAQVPNKWITELRTDSGIGKEYEIDTLHSTFAFGSLNLQVVFVFSGRYMGPQTISVPALSNATAQRFDLIGRFTMFLGGTAVVQDSGTQSQWLVSGYGIVKASQPRLIIIPPFGSPDTAILGSEKEMTSYGVAPAAVSEPNQVASSSIQFYPDPAAENVTLSFDHPVRRVMLYAAAGSMVRSFDLATNTGDVLLWVKDIPNGVYLARVQFANGTDASKKLVIQH